jgi:hypothetical protein
MPKKWRAASSVSFLPATGDKQLDDWIEPQRAAAIARILKAVGRSLTTDEILLADDIHHAYIETPGLLTAAKGSSFSNISLLIIREGKSGRCAANRCSGGWTAAN